MTRIETKPKGLEGRCFVIWGKGPSGQVAQYKGHVVSHLGDGYYLCQFFDAIMGEPSTMGIYHVASMVDGGRKDGSFTFFENDEHLRYWDQTWGKGAA